MLIASARCSLIRAELAAFSTIFFVLFILQFKVFGPRLSTDQREPMHNIKRTRSRLVLSHASWLMHSEVASQKHAFDRVCEGPRDRIWCVHGGVFDTFRILPTVFIECLCRRRTTKRRRCLHGMVNGVITRNDGSEIKIAYRYRRDLCRRSGVGSGPGTRPNIFCPSTAFLLA